MMHKWYFLAIAAFIFLNACSAPIIKATAPAPARFDDATRIREVAVLPFDGTGGNDLASQIEGILASITLGGHRYFTVVDRMKLNKVISELNLSQSGLVDAHGIAKLGMLTGAKGIYTGVVTESRSTDSRYIEKRNRCAHWKKVGEGYNTFDVCQRYEYYDEPCVKRTAVFSFTPKLINVETGQIVYSNVLSGMAESSGCVDSRTPVKSGEELIRAARDISLIAFRKDIAPYIISFNIRLMNSTDGLLSREAKDKFEAGLKYAKGKRMDRACELWNEVYLISSGSPALLYNLGVCAEITWKLDKALTLYNEADKILGKPHRDINTAIERVSKALGRQDKIKTQTQIK